MKDDRLYLIYILERIQRIRQYTSDGREAFMASTLVQDAVLRNLHTLTETCQRLSEDVRVAHSEVPWRRIAGFRNVVVHDYLGLDLDRVWEAVVRDVPPLESFVETMLGDV